MQIVKGEAMDRAEIIWMRDRSIEHQKELEKAPYESDGLKSPKDAYAAAKRFTASAIEKLCDALLMDDGDRCPECGGRFVEGWLMATHRCPDPVANWSA